MLKKCCNFKLLTLVSMSNFLLAYSIQCLIVFLVFCTDIKMYIDVCFTGKKQHVSMNENIIKNIDRNDDIRIYL